jgi:1,2-diacylglycerol 3-beta-galactosyltransferase
LIVDTQRILILMSDTGGGHRAAAEAIRDAMRSLFGERFQVIVEDLFAQSHFPTSLLPKTYLPLITYAEWSWGPLFHWTNGYRRARLVSRLLKLSLTDALERLYAKYKPGLVVCVHPMMTYSGCVELRAFDPTTQFITVITDLYDAHAFWFYDKVDLLIVPTQAVAERGQGYGISPAKLRVIGQPIGLEFSDAGSTKRESRVELGLEENCFTVLLVGGGEGMGKLGDIATAISDARLPLQLAIIAGRNQALRKKLDARPWKIPVKTTGFVSNMPTWMRASDVIITKGGPGTIMEAMTSGLPIILSGYLRGQEEGNVKFVQESKVGVLRTDRQIVCQLKEWLKPGNRELIACGTCVAQSRPRASRKLPNYWRACWKNEQGCVENSSQSHQRRDFVSNGLWQCAAIGCNADCSTG